MCLKLWDCLLNQQVIPAVSTVGMAGLGKNSVAEKKLVCEAVKERTF